jgi:RNA polymerase sigma factor (sigma-70 family)
MIEELYKKNYNKYVNIMARILHRDYAAAEDVVQEAFCRAWKFRHSYDENRASLETWFNKILFNSLRDVQMEMRGNPLEMPQEVSAEDLFPAPDYWKNPEFGKMIRDKVEGVDNPKHRSVLFLFYIMGYTSTEISQIEEGVSVTNITSIVSRFRNKLTKEMKWV